MRLQQCHRADALGVSEGAHSRDWSLICECNGRSALAKHPSLGGCGDVATEVTSPRCSTNTRSIAPVLESQLMHLMSPEAVHPGVLVEKAAAREVVGVRRKLALYLTLWGRRRAAALEVRTSDGVQHAHVQLACLRLWPGPRQPVIHPGQNCACKLTSHDEVVLRGWNVVY